MLIKAVPSDYANEIIVNLLSTFRIQRAYQVNICTAQTETVIARPIITTHVNEKVEEVRVDMAEMKVENRPIELVTSVGSCIAICMYDQKNRCGGLAHIMLPTAAIAPNEQLPSKYADTAVPALIEGIQKIAKKEGCLSAKMVGGANMFSNIKNNTLEIGAKNIVAVRETLGNYGVRLTGVDVGGTHGRRVSFNVETGVTSVRQFNGEIMKI